MYSLSHLSIVSELAQSVDSTYSSVTSFEPQMHALGEDGGGACPGVPRAVARGGGWGGADRATPVLDSRDRERVRACAAFFSRKTI